MASMLFLCAANADRSPMAEAIARHLGRGLEVWSAGPRPSHVRPGVTLALREAGIEAVGLRAKGLMEVPLDEVDVVINLCTETRLPLLRPSVRRYSWPLPDPSCAPREESLEAFRATRDELQRRLPPLLRELGLLR